MPGSNLFELMNLGGGSDARSLSQLAVAAVRSVPGCLAVSPCSSLRPIPTCPR